MTLILNNDIAYPIQVNSFNIDAFTNYPSSSLLLLSNDKKIKYFLNKKITDIILKADSIIAGELHDIDARIARIDEELIDGQVKAVISIHFNI